MNIFSTKGSTQRLCSTAKVSLSKYFRKYGNNVVQWNLSIVVAQLRNHFVITVTYMYSYSQIPSDVILYFGTYVKQPLLYNAGP